MTEEVRPPLPPFDEAMARQKVQMAENAWNTRDPDRVVLAYTPDTVWRNRADFLQGRDEVRAFLTGKWQRERDYRLKKWLWSFTGDHIAVKFQYEFHDADGQWYRAYGNELWEFAANGLMRRREASINDCPIAEAGRKFHWDRAEPTPAFPMDLR